MNLELLGQAVSWDWVTWCITKPYFSRYSLSTVDSQIGESGYGLGGRCEGIVGRGTLQRIPEEGSSDGGIGGWTQPGSSWPVSKEQPKKENADEELLIRPGELSVNRPEELTKRPEDLPTVKPDQARKSDPTAREVDQEREELGISHLILHTKETFIA